MNSNAKLYEFVSKVGDSHTRHVWNHEGTAEEAQASFLSWRRYMKFPSLKIVSVRVLTNNK